MLLTLSEMINVFANSNSYILVNDSKTLIFDGIRLQ